MKNRVHYGEFTLDYWIDQIISGGIELPEYQRSYVWTPEQVERLISSISKDEFVPPVIIGKIDDKNIIIDGQQRLTSILLAYLNVFPKARKYQRTIKHPGENEGDEIEEEHYFDWTFNTIKELGSSIAEVKNNLIGNEDYEPLEYRWFNLDALKKHYLGFSYIIPNNDSTQDEKHKFFSSIFRNVNIGGTGLLKAESRKSLYYLNPSYVPFFNPEFMKNFTVKQVGESVEVDFLRQLALVFDFAKNGIPKLMKGYKSKSETYYEKFIYDVINGTSSIFKPFNEIMSVGNIVERMNMLDTEIQKVGIPHEFTSTIDADMYLFGIIYWVLICNETLKDDADSLNSLHHRLSRKISSMKRVPDHSKSPGTLKYLRERMEQSVKIYQRCRKPKD